MLEGRGSFPPPTRFEPLDVFPPLQPLVRHWGTIREEAQKLTLPNMPIHRIGKQHVEVMSEIEAYLNSGGEYGWVLGWGLAGGSRNWRQLGLLNSGKVISPIIPFMPKTCEILSECHIIKTAALSEMGPHVYLKPHTHPELRPHGLLQLHISLIPEGQDDNAYFNVDGDFRRYHAGEMFVFDGSYRHFAVNASDCKRLILYAEFEGQIDTRRLGA